MNAFPSPPLPRDANSDLSPIEDEALGTLPRWKLSDLYTSTDDPAINRDLEWAETQARELAAAASHGRRAQSRAQRPRSGGRRPPRGVRPRRRRAPWRRR